MSDKTQSYWAKYGATRGKRVWRAICDEAKSNGGDHLLYSSAIELAGHIFLTSFDEMPSEKALKGYFRRFEIYKLIEIDEDGTMIRILKWADGVKPPEPKPVEKKE